MRICENGIYRDATPAEEAQYAADAAQTIAEMEGREPTIEEQNDALLQYVNDKTNGNHADLSAAVEGLVNNIKQ